MGVKPQQLASAISREHQKQDVTNGSPLDDLGLNTERKVGRGKLPVMPAYLLKEKGEAKETQEQTILANAVC